MKQCPTCSRIYSDDSFTYCLDDGSVLVAVDPQATLRMPPPQPTGPKVIKTLVGSPTPIYQGSPDQPFPGSPTPPYQAPQPTHRWLLYVSLALFLLLLGGGGIALLLFELKVSPATARETNQGSASQADAKPLVSPASNGTPTPAPSPSPYSDNDLVGTWRTQVNEQGLKMEITVTFLVDGSTRYAFKDAQGTETDHASWRYSDGILYERYSNGKSGKDSINWIDRNNFVLTIIDNGRPAYAGVKRRYHRITQAPG